MKKNYTERMNALNNAGIDTSKFFNLAIDKELPKGTTLTITIGDDGKPSLTAMEMTRIVEAIEEQGYVKNSNLFRRWVMAQTFRMMKHPNGFTGALNEKPYKYQWEMLENELHAMSKIEKEDPEQFRERKDFFTKEVVLAMLNDYKAKWIQEVRKNKNRYYGNYLERCCGDAIGIANITIEHITKNAEDYTDLYNYVKAFNKEMKTGRPDITLPKETPKCREWIDAYKGAGAYYTLKNYFMFHADPKRIVLPLDNGGAIVKDRKFALEHLKYKKAYHKKEWYKLFGYMKEVIKLNGFDFDYAMYKQYHK